MLGTYQAYSLELQCPHSHELPFNQFITTRISWKSLQLMTSRASGSLASKRKPMVVVISSPSSCSCRNISASCFAYKPRGKICHAYSVSPSGVLILKGVTCRLAKPNSSGRLISIPQSSLAKCAYRALKYHVTRET